MYEYVDVFYNRIGGLESESTYNRVKVVANGVNPV